MKESTPVILYKSIPVHNVKTLLKDTDFNTIEELNDIVDRYNLTNAIYMTNKAWWKYESLIDKPKGKRG